MMDTAALRLKVFEKTGQRISEHDPIFLAAALNDVLLEETTASINELADRIAQQAENLISAAGSVDRLIEEKAAQAVDLAANGARDKIQQAAIDSLATIAESTKANIKVAAGEAVLSIQRAAAEADIRIGKMVSRLEHAGTTISWSVGGMLFAMIAGGMLGGSLMFYLLKTAGFLSKI